MDARYDSSNGHSYYVKAADIQPIGVKGSRIGKSIDRNRISTVTDRTEFLRLFKDYIHSDVWTSDDYDKQGKQGIVMRLRLSDSPSGQFVIQECGEKVGKCNKLYLATQDAIAKIQEEYLNQNRLLRTSQSVEPPTLSFQCKACGDPNASHFLRSAKKLDFYCNIDCFYKRMRGD